MELLRTICLRKIVDYRSRVDTFYATFFFIQKNVVFFIRQCRLPEVSSVTLKVVKKCVL